LSPNQPPQQPASFSDLSLSEPVLRALRGRGYERPTPIQVQAIPPVLAGRDLLGVAQTGTGKTAAFAVPLVERLAANPRPVRPRAPRVLVLTPTRELAAQIDESFRAYGKHHRTTSVVIHGGVGQGPQVTALRRGVEVAVATPGRLLDLLGQRHVDLAHVEAFVLDEADRMLDMGFVRDVQRIVLALPRRRQSLFFSATMPDAIVRLSRSILTDPVRVEVTPAATTVERVEQRVMFVEKANKRPLLLHVLGDRALERVLVFARTKVGAERVARFLSTHGVSVAAIHGDKGQGAREAALEGFRRGSVRVLVATDIAARGLDVPGVTHVLNFDLPHVPEDYVHRIGRTARAGRAGVAISFCDVGERLLLTDIERTIRRTLEVVADHPHASAVPFAATRVQGAPGAPPRALPRPFGRRVRAVRW
jgi:ATP-dependent RNA helicase RhlE